MPDDARPSGRLPRYLITLLEGLDTARSLSVAILARYGEWNQIAEMRLEPQLYDDSELLWRDAMATELLRKAEDLPTSGYDLEADARAKFHEAERQCHYSNRRLQPYLYGWSHPDWDERIAEFLRNVKKVVYEIIGPGPRLGENRTYQTPEGVRFDYAPNNPMGGFGPGATVSDPSRRSTVAHKLASIPSITPNAIPLLRFWEETIWGELQAGLGNEPSVEESNIFFTVLKDATALRGCAKEPSINSFYQKWLGGELRTSLRRWGINLETGQDLHRKLAREGSANGKIATIDLRSASDTACTTLVRLCLPSTWYEWLSAARSPKTTVDGKVYLLDKFSSMGNGFTFELETLLFAAIAKVACGDSAIVGQNFSVYGDDIIVPVEYAKEVLAALSFFGFSPNQRKTFTEGEFRESCGGDYFRGVGVRAHYIKELPYEPQHYIALANGLRRSCYQAGCCSKTAADRWNLVRRAWFQVLDELPSPIRSLKGPAELGDLVIHDDESLWRCRTKDCIRYVRVYQPARFKRVRFGDFSGCVQLAAVLYGVVLDKPLEETANRGLIPRDAVLGYKIGWVPFS